MSLPEISLPADDQLIAALSPELRERIGERWRERTRGELSTASTFTHVARAVMELGAVPDVLWMAAKAVSDEIRHAEICRRVSEAYLGRTVEMPLAETIEFARFGTADPRLNALLLVVAHSCINEGIALAYLQEQQQLATAPIVRAALQHFMRDDVDHARIGWAQLSSFATKASDKRQIAEALPSVLRLVSELWLAPLQTEVDCPEHGCLGTMRMHQIVKATLAELVLPGFDHVGVSTERSRAWFREAFET